MKIGPPEGGPASSQNTVQQLLLWSESGDECAPVCVHCSRCIRDVVVAHPDRSVLISRGCGVIAPTCGAKTGRELWVSTEAVLRKCSRARDPYGARSIDVYWRVACAGEEVDAHYAERHYAFTRAVDCNRWVEHATLVGIVNRDLALVHNRCRYGSVSRSRRKDEPWCRRAYRTILGFRRTVECRPQLVVSKDNLLHAVIVGGHQLQVVFQ